MRKLHRLKCKILLPGYQIYIDESFCRKNYHQVNITQKRSVLLWEGKTLVSVARQQVDLARAGIITKNLHMCKMNTWGRDGGAEVSTVISRQEGRRLGSSTPTTLRCRYAVIKNGWIDDKQFIYLSYFYEQCLNRSLCFLRSVFHTLWTCWLNLHRCGS